MPVQKVKGGYRWGDSGTIYRTRVEAAREGRRIKARQLQKRIANQAKQSS